jgi:hypothetical protein
VDIERDQSDKFKRDKGEFFTTIFLIYHTHTNNRETVDVNEMKIVFKKNKFI